MSCFFSTRFQRVSLAVLLTVVAALVLTTAPGVSRAQSSSWNAKYEEIHRMYYIMGQQKDAIQALEDQLEAAGNTYSNEVLSKILKILKEYFAISQDTARFEKIIFEMLEPKRIDRIVDHFKGTKMYDTARKAKRNWLRPTAASISIDADELDIGDSVGYRISATNQKKKPVSAGDVSVTASPEDYARVAGGKITALQSGKVTITVSDADGNVLAQRDITVSEGLGVTVTPDHKQLSIDESEDFIIQSNKPFDKFEIKTILDPPGLVTGNEFPTEPNADKKRIRITAKKSGTVLLKVTDVGGTGLAQATIYIPPEAPSMLFPLVGTGVTVGVGVLSFLQRMAANDKFDEHEACVQALPPGEDTGECSAPFDDYESKHNLSNIGFAVTGLAAVGTGYLWYKYFKDKGEYEKKLSEGTQPISLRVDPMTGHVVLNYNF
jgi:hypothetical protein